MDWTLFLSVLAVVESGDNKNLVGDTRLAHRAYTRYQIRQPYLDDVNQLRSHDIEKAIGRPLMMADLRQSEHIARWVVISYMAHYGKVYRRKTGKEPTIEVYARIHNGGPTGWNKAATTAFWVKFSEEWNRQSEEAA